LLKQFVQNFCLNKQQINQKKQKMLVFPIFQFADFVYPDK